MYILSRGEDPFILSIHLFTVFSTSVLYRVSWRLACTTQSALHALLLPIHEYTSLLMSILYNPCPWPCIKMQWPTVTSSTCFIVHVQWNMATEQKCDQCATAIHSYPCGTHVASSFKSMHWQNSIQHHSPPSSSRLFV